ncbi:MAG: hypothetical protein J6A59_01770 [Lachnospiraceae bacterium]|nr:hypothetical protein [Lachnospiraceae bacterium]
MLIHKEALPNNTGIVPVKLPFESGKEARENILHLEVQFNTPCMWFNVVREVQKEFLIVCIGTGHDWEDKLLREEYIGSLVVAEGFYVWHYFLVDKEKFEKRLGSKDEN